MQIAGPSSFGGNDGGGGRWTDTNSSAMRHCDEAYRCHPELHRRAIAWRVTSLSSESADALTIGRRYYWKDQPIKALYFTAKIQSLTSYKTQQSNNRQRYSSHFSLSKVIVVDCCM